MENFIVSARRYRPITFKSVVGQENITSTLQNSIRNNHLAQAFLFCGPRGVGKTTCARILAKTINCFSLSSETEPCNNCESCRAFNENASFNIHELDAASNNSVDDIRQLIDQVRFAPQVGKFSIYIIDEVHMLSTSAFNAFLKTLEEPPAHAIFILATTERHKILPTILSRCQVYTFNRIKVDDISKHLEYVASRENVQADPEALHIIAQKADGGLRDALSMFDQIVSFSAGSSITYESVIENLNVLDYDYYFRITEFLLNGSYGEALLLFNEILQHGFEGGNFISGLGDHFRNLLVCKDNSTLQLLEVSAGIKSRYQSQSQLCEPLVLIKALEISGKTEHDLRTSKNQRLTVELGLLQLSLLNIPVEYSGASTTDTVAQQSPQKNSAKPSVNQPEKKTTLSFRSGSPIKTVSIRKHLHNAEEIEPDNKTPEDHSITENQTNKDLDNDSIVACWKNYAQKLKENGRTAMWGTLTLSEPNLSEDYVVYYEVQNESQLRELELEKPDLLGYIRKNLQNYKIQIVLSKASAPPKNKPFSAEEKIKALEERNPNIAILRKKLGLHPE